jgi:hypothetical protein
LYITGAGTRRQLSLEEDDDMLQYAIQQSLMQAGADDDQVKGFHFNNSSLC